MLTVSGGARHGGCAKLSLGEGELLRNKIPKGMIRISQKF